MIYNLQRKFGRYAIPNLTKYVAILYVIEYLLYAVGLYGYFGLYFIFDPRLVMAGQVWRLVTWILVPPIMSGPLQTFLTIFIFWQFGTILERSWGDFKYNFFLFNGVIVTVVLSFAAVYIGAAMGITVPYFGYMNTYYITLTTFLAVAACYPEMEVLFMFFIPMKFKWSAAIFFVFILIDVIDAIRYGAVYMLIAIVAALLNLGIMLYMLKVGSFNPRAGFEQAKRKMQWKAGVNKAGKTGNRSADGRITKHKCAICGRTELDGDDLQFRFCSKCNGNYEYCQEHLFTHMHK